MKLKSVKLSSAEVDALSQIMSKGNVLLEQCAQMFGMNARDFRGKLFNKKLDLSKLSPEELTKFHEAVPHIMRVKNECENQILSGFRMLVLKQSHAAAQNCPDSSNARENYEQEGYIALLDAIYGYTNIKIKFITYAWRVLRHKFQRADNNNNPFKPLTNAALRLYKLFNDKKSQLSTAGWVSDEEVLDKLNLSKEDRNLLGDITRKVLIPSQIKEEDYVDNEFGSDYTAGRHGIDNDVDFFFQKKEVRTAFKNADLEPIELDLLFAEILPYPGWQEHIASKHVNPKTGNRYTRAAIGAGILDRAHRKVRQALQNPPKIHKENPEIDQIFNELSGECD